MGWSAIIVSASAIVAKASSGCAMVSVSSWVADFCGQARALGLLGVLGVPHSSVRSFVADDPGAILVRMAGVPPTARVSTYSAFVTPPSCCRVGRQRFMC